MPEKDKEQLGWCVVEQLGHKRLTAFVSEAEIAGAGFLRLDVPGPDTKDEGGPFAATQFVRPESVYAITPTTRDLAIKAAGINSLAPVSRWDLKEERPALPAPAKHYSDIDDADILDLAEVAVEDEPTPETPADGTIDWLPVGEDLVSRCGNFRVLETSTDSFFGVDERFVEVVERFSPTCTLDEAKAWCEERRRTVAKVETAAASKGEPYPPF